MREDEELDEAVREDEELDEAVREDEELDEAVIRAMMEKPSSNAAQLELVPSGVLDLFTLDGKGSLELIRWRDEPAVVVDGKWIIRRTTLIQQLTRGGGSRG